MGIGISSFLKTSASDGRGDKIWLPKWKDAGSVVLWLHTKAEPCVAWTHSFIVAGESEERINGEKTGRMKQFLQFPHYVSPDPREVHASQYFRNDDGTLKTPPNRDPFLLLREWLRNQINAGLLSPDAVVFEWDDAKNSTTIRWEAGVLSKLVKPGRGNWNHSLDSKYEGIFTVVQNDKPEDGAFLVREGKALCEAMRKKIAEEIDSKGDEEGDPTITPYAFKWRFDKNALPADMYAVSRFDKAKYTDEIYKAISGDEFPSAAEQLSVKDDDFIKIRAAFESAARIALPLDAIFSDDSAERRSVLSTKPQRGAAVAAPKPAQDAVKPTARLGGPKPPPSSAAPQVAPVAAAQTSRKLKAKPVVEMIPCDSCQKPMPVTAAKCDGCGAEYDVDAAPEPVVAAQHDTGDDYENDVATGAHVHSDEPTTCGFCGSKRIKDGSCADCGMSTSDNIPF